MKRRYITYMLSLLVLVACQERTPEFFQDITGVYFNNTSATMSVTDSLDLTFVYEAGDEMEVPVKVQLLGRSADQDRPLTVTVSSDNAQEGIDYVLPQQAVMPAGASSVDYMVVLKRTDALKSERKMIRLTLHANEYFDLPVSQMEQIADTVSIVDVRIYFSDMFTKAPAAWDENLLGKFTQQKFELICKVLQINPADFNDPSLITLAKMLYISAEMTAYVAEQKENRDAGREYDKDAFDPKTNEPLTFR
ncbi:MAG: DUF4843 domain-containing protein [Bacteroidales bacterium]|nr:DUF4843 domain-containing protein [Bacteroidales bacterium]